MIMHPDIGLLNSGKCYVFLEGYGMNREPMYGTYEECLNAIDSRGGVDDPIPTDGTRSMCDYKAALKASKPKELPVAVTTSQEAVGTKKRVLREYLVTFRTIDKNWRDVDGFREGSEPVFAYDRNDALRQGRGIIRDNVGSYGPKIAITARLAQ